MARGALSNQLLGKLVGPKQEQGWGNPSVLDGSMNAQTWSGLAPNASGEWLATIDAAWIDTDGNVKIAVHDVHGNMKEMWLTHVQLHSVSR